MNSPSLPIVRNLSRAFAFSLIVAVLTAIASMMGIFFQSIIYSIQALRQSFVPNDVVNLFIGLPLLLGAMWFARRGKLIGLLFLPGALFYVVYNYIAYLIAMPITAMSLIYLTLVSLSAYAIIQIVAGIDAKIVQQRLTGAVPARFGGGFLFGFGFLFFFRSIGVIVSWPATSTDYAVAIADLVITPVWIVVGAFLWRRHSWGYTLGLGLLFQASMLFIGLLVFFMLQPILTTAPFAAADAVVIFFMGLICFIPFGLFVRGVISKEIVQ